MNQYLSAFMTDKHSYVNMILSIYIHITVLNFVSLSIQVAVIYGLYACLLFLISSTRFAIKTYPVLNHGSQISYMIAGNIAFV